MPSSGVFTALCINHVPDACLASLLPLVSVCLHQVGTSQRQKRVVLDDSAGASEPECPDGGLCVVKQQEGSL